MLPSVWTECSWKCCRGTQRGYNLTQSWLLTNTFVCTQHFEAPTHGRLWWQEGVTVWLEAEQWLCSGATLRQSGSGGGGAGQAWSWAANIPAAPGLCVPSKALRLGNHTALGERVGSRIREGAGADGCKKEGKNPANKTRCGTGETPFICCCRTWLMLHVSTLKKRQETSAAGQHSSILLPFSSPSTKI